MSKVIVVDFDQTINSSRYGQLGKPTKGVKEAFQKFKDMGFEIHILSCRTSPDVHRHPIDRQEEVREMIGYLDLYEIPYDVVLNKDKPVAHWYIDDRAIGFRGDWEVVIKEIENE